MPIMGVRTASVEARVTPTRQPRPASRIREVMWSCGVNPSRYPAKCVCSGVLTISRPPRVTIRIPSARSERNVSVTRAARKSPVP